MTAPVPAPPDLPALRNALVTTVDLLNRRRAGLIDEALIDGYVRLKWLEWNGGTLRLTALGARLFDELSAGLGDTAPAD